MKIRRNRRLIKKECRRSANFILSIINERYRIAEKKMVMASYNADYKSIEAMAWFRLKAFPGWEFTVLDGHAGLRYIGKLKGAVFDPRDSANCFTSPSIYDFFIMLKTIECNNGYLSAEQEERDKCNKKC